MQCLILSVVWAFLLGSLATQAYPSNAWPMYVQAPRDYSDDDYPAYYQAPKTPYYYEAPVMNTPDIYGRIPQPYYYENYPSHYVDEDPVRQDERLAALPVGQETWYESETEPPSWRSRENDDVHAAFVENLVLSQMAKEAQRRREYNRNSQALNINNLKERAMEDEDVRELKALADKPLYHTPKTAPKFDEDDYPADDAFINWNGNKRSIMTTSTSAPTIKLKEGQDEIMVPRPASTHQHHAYANEENKDTVYDKITQILEDQAKYGHDSKIASPRNMKKRFVATDRDVVAELRGLKHRIPT